MKSFAAPRRPLSGLPGLSRGVRAPDLVIERQTLPSLPVGTPLGGAVAISGGILLVEALVSLATADDQSTWPVVFRVFRLLVGGGLLGWVVASSI